MRLVAMRPPAPRPLSSTVTACPARSSTPAAASPATPAPTTTTCMAALRSDAVAGSILGVVCAHATIEEVEQQPVERAGVFDHQPVGRPRDDDQLAVGDALSELFRVAAWREDVLVADEHERWHGEVGELRRHGVVDAENRPHLSDESMRRPPEREGAEPAEQRPDPPERPRA